MDKIQADSWLGKGARYERSIAEFATDRCSAPTYMLKIVDADRFFTEEFRVKAASLGIPSSKIAVVEITCGGSHWIAPGSLLVVKSKERLLTVWDGVFFELAR